MANLKKQYGIGSVERLGIGIGKKQQQKDGRWNERRLDIRKDGKLFQRCSMKSGLH